MLGSLKEQRFSEFWNDNKSKLRAINPSKDCQHHCVANHKTKCFINISIPTLFTKFLFEKVNHGETSEIVTPLHQATQRDYLARMQDEKVHCMQVAKQFEKDYWDGERRYGYGGYSYLPGRWKSVAEELIKMYELTNQSSVLDVGCGKAFCFMK